MKWSAGAAGCHVPSGGRRGGRMWVYRESLCSLGLKITSPREMQMFDQSGQTDSELSIECPVLVQVSLLECKS